MPKHKRRAFGLAIALVRAADKDATNARWERAETRLGRAQRLANRFELHLEGLETQ